MAHLNRWASIMRCLSSLFRPVPKIEAVSSIWPADVLLCWFSSANGQSALRPSCTGRKPSPGSPHNGQGGAKGTCKGAKPAKGREPHKGRKPAKGEREPATNKKPAKGWEPPKAGSPRRAGSPPQAESPEAFRKKGRKGGEGRRRVGAREGPQSHC